VIVLAVEAVAGAEIIQRWVDIPIWASSLVLMFLLTLTNLASVRSYGEFEFWFASIKVAAIIAFIFLALGFAVGVVGDGGSFSHLSGDDGFAPEGISKVLTGVVIVIFAFVGAEIATIAAAESDEPRRAVTKATNSVIGRGLVFYVLSVFLIVSILPWNDTKLGESPFVAALDLIGVPGAADVMNAIVLTAVLSCLNSGIYVASRMMFALANRGDAPQWTVKINSRGVPARAILLATCVGYVSVIFAALWPETIFLWLVNSSGAVALFVYLLIAMSELRMRARLEREDPGKLQVRMWGYPWLTYLVIAAIVVVIGSMAFVADVRDQLWWSLGSLAVVLLTAWARSRQPARRTSPRATSRAATT
jgi:GABA permease